MASEQELRAQISQRRQELARAREQQRVTTAQMLQQKQGISQILEAQRRQQTIAKISQAEQEITSYEKELDKQLAEEAAAAVAIAKAKEAAIPWYLRGWGATSGGTVVSPKGGKGMTFYTMPTTKEIISSTEMTKQVGEIYKKQTGTFRGVPTYETIYRDTQGNERLASRSEAEYYNQRTSSLGTGGGSVPFYQKIIQQIPKMEEIYKQYPSERIPTTLSVMEQKIIKEKTAAPFYGYTPSTSIMQEARASQISIPITIERQVLPSREGELYQKKVSEYRGTPVYEIRFRSSTGETRKATQAEQNYFRKQTNVLKTGGAPVSVFQKVQYEIGKKQPEVYNVLTSTVYPTVQQATKKGVYAVEEIPTSETMTPFEFFRTKEKGEVLSPFASFSLFEEKVAKATTKKIMSPWADIFGEPEEVMKQVRESQKMLPKWMRLLPAEEEITGSWLGFLKGGYTGVRERPVSTVALTAASFAFPFIFGEAAAAVPAVGKAAPWISKGLGTAYAGYTGYRVLGKPTSIGKGEAFGEIFTTEIVPFYIGGKLGTEFYTRYQLKNIIKQELKNLPPEQRTRFENYLEQAQEIKKLYRPAVKDIDLKQVERLPSRAQKPILDYLKTSKDVVGGSVAQRTQVYKKLPSSHDVDIFTELDPSQQARKLYNILQKAGVQRVSIPPKNQNQITIEGRKAVEFHSIDKLKQNIKSVIGYFEPSGKYITETPSGIKVMDVRAQVVRKVVGAIEGRPEDIKQYDIIRRSLEETAKIKEGETLFFKEQKKIITKGLISDVFLAKVVEAPKPKDIYISETPLTTGEIPTSQKVGITGGYLYNYPEVKNYFLAPKPSETYKYPKKETYPSYPAAVPKVSYSIIPKPSTYPISLNVLKPYPYPKETVGVTIPKPISTSYPKKEYRNIPYPEPIPYPKPVPYPKPLKVPPVVPSKPPVKSILGVPSQRKKLKIFKAWQTYVKTKKGFIPFGLPTEKGEAIRRGERKIRESLLATFMIRPKGAILLPERPYLPPKKVFREFKIIKGRKIGLPETWIQKAGTRKEPTIRGARLASRAEVLELQRARRASIHNRFISPKRTFHRKKKKKGIFDWF